MDFKGATLHSRETKLYGEPAQKKDSICYFVARDDNKVVLDLVKWNINKQSHDVYSTLNLNKEKEGTVLRNGHQETFKMKKSN